MDLDHDKTIAIAEGILIDRHRITPAEAARMLAALARADSLSLIEAAEWLIVTPTGDLRRRLLRPLVRGGTPRCLAPGPVSTPWCREGCPRRPAGRVAGSWS